MGISINGNLENRYVKPVYIPNRFYVKREISIWQNGCLGKTDAE